MFDDKLDELVSMKPLLSVAVENAFRLALCDSLGTTREREQAIVENIYELTEDEWNSISPAAFCRNLSNRLFGCGGWTVRGVYAGNATSQKIFDSCVRGQ